MKPKSPCNGCRRAVHTFVQETKTMPQDETNQVQITRETICGYCGRLIKRETTNAKQK